MRVPPFLNSRTALLTAAAAVFSLLVLAEYLSFPFSLSLFYFLPVLAAAFWGDRKTAFLAALLGTATEGALLCLLPHTLSAPQKIWAFISQGTLLFLSAFLMSELKTARRSRLESLQNDPLTGIPHGRRFFEWVQMEIHRCARYRRPFTVAYLDLDDFKGVNDAFGYRVGDELLRKIAEALQNNIRKTDLIARLGGDEFALLLPETGYDGARFFIRRLQKNMEDFMKKNGWALSLSGGVATFNHPPAQVDAVLWKADRLLHRAKLAGKNQFFHEIAEERPLQEESK